MQECFVNSTLVILVLIPGRHHVPECRHLGIPTLHRWFLQKRWVHVLVGIRVIHGWSGHLFRTSVLIHQGFPLIPPLHALPTSLGPKQGLVALVGPGRWGVVALHVVHAG